MTATTTALPTLPSDWTSATLLGRAWIPGAVAGPAPVTGLPDRTVIGLPAVPPPLTHLPAPHHAPNPGPPAPCREPRGGGAPDCVPDAVGQFLTVREVVVGTDLEMHDRLPLTSDPGSIRPQPARRLGESDPV